MTDIGSQIGPVGSRKWAVAGSPLQDLARRLLMPLVALWICAGGFVLIEPSPYEFMFLLVLPVAVVAGVGLHRGTLGIINLMVLFIPFALIGAFQVRQTPLMDGLIYVAITIFLWLTAYIAANIVADAPRRNLGLIVRAYTFVAVAITLLGTLAYLGVLPGAEFLLKYGRVKATFEDPNVFGPFLVVPAMFALQRAFLRSGRRALTSALVYTILFVGIFVSFSRGAWGHMALSSFLLFAMCFLLEATPRDRGRMLGTAVVGALVVLGILLALLSIEPVRDLFLNRASLLQNYDGGETGRFGRQAYAFELALGHPWGIGPLEFKNLRVMEAPHNTYVKVLLTYGWLGGLAYFALIWMTLKKGFGTILRRPDSRPLMIPLVAVFVPLIIEAAVIDTDHWRHYFLVVGLIWGVAAGHDRTRPTPGDRRAALI